MNGVNAQIVSRLGKENSEVLLNGSGLDSTNCAGGCVLANICSGVSEGAATIRAHKSRDKASWGTLLGRAKCKPSLKP